MEVGVRDLRKNLSAILDAVDRGVEVVIRRRGRIVARLVPPAPQKDRLPSLDHFRAQLQPKGPALSEMVISARQTERH